MARGAERHPLHGIPRIGVHRVVGGDQLRDVDQILSSSGLSRTSIHHDAILTREAAPGHLTTFTLGYAAFQIFTTDFAAAERRSAGIGNLALLALVARVGTGTGFTIAQLSLLVNASVGVWVFHVPEPGTRQARKVLAGIVVAGIGGCVIAATR